MCPIASISGMFTLINVEMRLDQTEYTSKLEILKAFYSACALNSDLSCVITFQSP